MTIGSFVKIIGIVCYGMAGIGLMVNITGDFNSNDVGLIIFFVVVGTVLTYIAKKIKRQSEDVNRYLTIIINEGERNIDTISALVGKQPNVVKKDIKKLIEKGILENAYIKESTREIFVANKIMQEIDVANQFVDEVDLLETQTQVVICPYCGAKNIIKDTHSECEYCGSPLK